MSHETTSTFPSTSDGPVVDSLDVGTSITCASPWGKGWPSYPPSRPRTPPLKPTSSPPALARKESSPGTKLSYSTLDSTLRLETPSSSPQQFISNRITSSPTSSRDKVLSSGGDGTRLEMLEEGVVVARSRRDGRGTLGIDVGTERVGVEEVGIDDELEALLDTFHQSVWETEGGEDRTYIPIESESDDNAEDEIVVLQFTFSIDTPPSDWTYERLAKAIKSNEITPRDIGSSVVLSRLIANLRERNIALSDAIREETTRDIWPDQLPRYTRPEFQSGRTEIHSRWWNKKDTPRDPLEPQKRISQVIFERICKINQDRLDRIRSALPDEEDQPKRSNGVKVALWLLTHVRIPIPVWSDVKWCSEKVENGVKNLAGKKKRKEEKG